MIKKNHFKGLCNVSILKNFNFNKSADLAKVKNKSFRGLCHCHK